MLNSFLADIHIGTSDDDLTKVLICVIIVDVAGIGLYYWRRAL